MTITAEDLKKITEQLYEDDSQNLLAIDVIGVEGVKAISKICIEWVLQSFQPEKGSGISVLSSTEVLPPMVAMGIGLFELGWKAHELEQMREVVPTEKLH